MNTYLLIRPSIHPGPFLVAPCGSHALVAPCWPHQSLPADCLMSLLVPALIYPFLTTISAQSFSLSFITGQHDY